MNHEGADRVSRVPAERRRLIADLLRRDGSVTISTLEREFGISAITARRDLALLAEDGIARRTYGGAVVPEFAAHEDSFQYRVGEAVEAKERLAEAAAALVLPGETVFVDSSTTAYFAARRLIERGAAVTLLTSSLAVMTLASDADAAAVEVVGVGGTLRRLTRSFVGPAAVATISAHFADRAVLSVRGLMADGQLTEPDALEAEVKRAMIRQSQHAVLLVDGTKLEHRALHVVCPARELELVVVDGGREETLARLARSGVSIRRTSDHSAHTPA